MDLSYLSEKPTRNYLPSINANLMDLPLKEMTWENFEKLCLRMVEEIEL